MLMCGNSLPAKPGLDVPICWRVLAGTERLVVEDRGPARLRCKGEGGLVAAPEEQHDGEIPDEVAQKDACEEVWPVGEAGHELCALVPRAAEGPRIVEAH